MSRRDLEQKRALLEAMPSERIVEPSNIPVPIYLREASRMINAGERDLELLESIGYRAGMLDDLKQRIGALRQAESLLRVSRCGKGEAGQRWDESLLLGRRVLKELKSALAFAYRKDEELSARVRAAVNGRSAAALVQGISSLAHLGRGNVKPLEAINFDLKRLDEAAALAGRLGEFLGSAEAEREWSHMCSRLRNAAYSHLKEGLKELRDYAHYVLGDDKLKKIDYNSQFLRKKRHKRRAAAALREQESENRALKLPADSQKAPEKRENSSEERVTVPEGCKEIELEHRESSVDCMERAAERREQAGKRRLQPAACVESTGERTGQPVRPGAHLREQLEPLRVEAESGNRMKEREFNEL